MTMRAAIYVRVSSEKQGEKVSPQAQEADCREYCQERGYIVVGVYHDIEKYRVGRKLIEPTGTRSDRVGLKKLLADGYKGCFDIIVAWREDRLYRGYRPMLDVLDCIDETGIDIELVKETFDQRIAPVKAWAARMELDAKHDRFMMGVAGRLAQGKAWNGGTPYGYEVIDDQFVINEEEARWVRSIWQWFGDGESGKSIRMKLIAGNAPQRNNVKNPWHIQQIYHMLKKAYYHQGFITRRWDSEVYEIPIPPIVDLVVVQKVKERFTRYKKFPAGNLKEKALAAGLLYCKACDARMKVKRNSASVYYQCACIDRFRERLDGCACTRSIRLLDAELWNKLWIFISQPEEFERALQERIEKLQAEDVNAEVDCTRLQRELDDLLMERQKVITWARKSIIGEEDLATQLNFLSSQENMLLRELADKRLLTGNRAEKLLELAQLYRDQIVAGIEAINNEPETEKQAELQFEFRKKIVNSIVKRVDVLTDKSIEIHTLIDLSQEISISPASLRSG